MTNQIYIIENGCVNKLSVEILKLVYNIIKMRIKQTSK